MSVNVPTKTPRENELEAMIAEKTVARDALNAEIKTLQEELNGLADERINTVKKALRDQFLVIAKMLVETKQQVPGDILSQLTDADRETLGYPRTFAQAATAGISENPENNGNPGNGENSGENSGNSWVPPETPNVSGNVLNMIWWIITYTIPLVDESYRTEFFNPRISGDKSRYATKLSELNAFAPTGVLVNLGFYKRENANTAAHLASDYVDDISDLFAEQQDRSTSEALQRITRLVFVGSLIRLTIEYLLTDDRTKSTMMKLINNGNPFELHVRKRTERYDDEEPKHRGKGKKFQNKKH